MSSPGTAVATGPVRPPDSPSPRRYFALAVLFFMNLLNYVDRYVFAAVGKSVTEDLKLTDARFGALAVSFMIVYTILSPLMGWMGDRYSRRRLLAFGVGLWSVATVGTTFSRDFYHMCFWRALLGVGEASYGIVAPALLADIFPLKHRGRVMGIFYLALPLGGALGYAIGGAVSDSVLGDRIALNLTGLNQGWRTAFLVVGLPGLLAAFAGLMIHDPGRGASEGHAPAGKADRPKLKDYLDLFKTRSYLYNIAGMAAVTFATGAYGMWGPSFYQRVRGMKENQAGLIIGVLTAISGLLGIALGIWLPDRFQKQTRRAYLLWASFAICVASPFAFLAVVTPARVPSLAILSIAMFLLASTLGPCNTVTANVIPANKRAAGFALNVFLIHLFGDICSPPLIGIFSDRLGRKSIAESWFGHLLAGLGASPVMTPEGPRNLTAGMLLVIPVLFLGAFFFLVGSRTLPEDMDRARKVGGSSSSEEVLLH